MSISLPFQLPFLLQDVMLSATSTQSPLAPVSSVFTMPSVSLPHVSIAGNGMGLSDQLFMSVPSVGDTATTPSGTESKTGEMAGESLVVVFVLGHTVRK